MRAAARSARPADLAEPHGAHHRDEPAGRVPVDFLSRALAEDFSKTFGGPFVVESRPGRTATSCGSGGKRRRPRHMLFVAPAGAVRHQHSSDDLHAFNPATDVAPVAMPGHRAPASRRASLGAGKRSRELLAWLRGEGAHAHYVLAGGPPRPGTSRWELLKSPQASMLRTFRTKGSPRRRRPEPTRGRVAMSFVNTSTTLQHLRDGRLRAIAVAEMKRIDAAPEIPTLAESGLPGSRRRRGWAWGALGAPRATSSTG